MAGLKGQLYPEDVMGEKPDNEELEATANDEAPLGEEARESDQDRQARLRRAEKIRKDAAKKSKALRE